MGFFDRLFGRDEQQAAPAPAAQPRPHHTPTTAIPRQQAAGQGAERSEDEIALERYRYLLRTAPPERVEQVHREAFEQLTPQQRQQVFQELSQQAPAGEAPRSAESADLAQAATRSELREPGTTERALSRAGGGFGATLGASLLGTVAGYVIGSTLMSAFLPSGDATADAGADGGEAGAEGGDTGTEAGDAGGDFGGESIDAAGADGGGFFGGDLFGGGGGDFGGFDI